MSEQLQSGYTLIELMIIVAIVGIIAAVAIPTYLDYATRAKAGEALALFPNVKMAVTEYYSAEGFFPDNNGEAGLDPPTAYRGNHVESITVGVDGVVTIKFDDPALNNGTFIFTPTTVTSGPIQWTCTTAIPSNLVPAVCRP